MKHKNLRRPLLLFFGFFIPCLIFFLFLISSVVIYFHASFHDELNSFQRRRVYQYQEYDPVRNKHSSGFARSHKVLMEDEFLTYRNKENGNSIFISPFSTFRSSNRFTCSGHCKCVTTSSNQRRVSIPIVTKPLLILLSALTTSIAIRMAQESFKNECDEFEQFFEDEYQFKEGEEESTDMDITDKYLRLTEKNINCETDIFTCDRSVEQFFGKKQNPEMIEYECVGYCLPAKLTSYHSLLAQDYFVDSFLGDCRNLEVTNTVEIPLSSVRHRKKGLSKKNEMFSARIAFTKQFLTPFCRESSQAEVRPEYVKLKGMLVGMRPQWRRGKRTIQMCQSYNPDLNKHETNIECHRSGEFSDIASDDDMQSILDDSIQIPGFNENFANDALLRKLLEEEENAPDESQEVPERGQNFIPADEKEEDGDVEDSFFLD